jgi:hypothetical protein
VFVQVIEGLKILVKNNLTNLILAETKEELGIDLDMKSLAVLVFHLYMSPSNDHILLRIRKLFLFALNEKKICQHC